MFEVLFIFLQKNKENLVEKNFEEIIEFCLNTIHKVFYRFFRIFLFI